MLRNVHTPLINRDKGHRSEKVKDLEKQYPLNPKFLLVFLDLAQHSVLIVPQNLSDDSLRQRRLTLNQKALPSLLPVSSSLFISLFCTPLFFDSRVQN